jgi:hypothetical protein
MGDTSWLDDQSLLPPLIGNTCVVQRIVVQGRPCGQYARRKQWCAIAQAEDAFLKVVDSVGIARVPMFQQERIARPLPRIGT